jgi:hypothetical protein
MGLVMDFGSTVLIDISLRVKEKRGFSEERKMDYRL